MVQQINALSNVVMISIIGFVIAAVIELFLKIPYIKRKLESNIIRTIGNDFK
ncbi:hypothetical protein [endosymbiont 'TC1' of Trimyema compressum]|uniref:hypothetical protein n=1 Tax=endosymbiont 'TC1' of Trimyema compressum TaxID=243899 RepID=UPI001392268B|nr:hypothetical protein [endosymbiont 'TC1' of Trimyema compressum]